MKFACFAFSAIVSVSALTRPNRFLAVYQDSWGNIGEWSSMPDHGISELILTWYVKTSRADGRAINAVEAWTYVDDDVREDIVEKFERIRGRVSMGVKVYDDSRPGNFVASDPEDFAEDVCEYAEKQEFNAVDWDLGDTPAVALGFSESYIRWLVVAAKECRDHVDYVTHAPRATYFATQGAGPLKGYGEILRRAGKNIHQLHIKYFGDATAAGNSGYTEIFVQNAVGSPNAESAIQQVATSAVASTKKLSVGALWSPTEGSAPQYGMDLVPMVCRAEQEFGYLGGLTYWKYTGTDQFPSFQEIAFGTSCAGSGGSDLPATDEPLQPPRTEEPGKTLPVTTTTTTTRTTKQSGVVEDGKTCSQKVMAIPPRPEMTGDCVSKCELYMNPAEYAKTWCYQIHIRNPAHCVIIMHHYCMFVPGYDPYN